MAEPIFTPQRTKTQQSQRSDKFPSIPSKQTEKRPLTLNMSRAEVSKEINNKVAEISSKN
jgi:hypothetical protein